MIDSSPSLLIIGGCDSSTAAGITIDLSIAHLLGVKAKVAVTAITAQSNDKVSHCQILPCDSVTAQIQLSLNSAPLSAVKIGQLANKEITKVVASLLPHDVPIILDPVLRSSSGYDLTFDDAIPVMKTDLFPKLHLITPNREEASRLTKIPITDKDFLFKAGSALLADGCHAVLITGGDSSADVIEDVLFLANGTHKLWQSPSIPADKNALRGTGCRLATATAIHMARGMNVITAVEQARTFLQKQLMQNVTSS